MGGDVSRMSALFFLLFCVATIGFVYALVNPRRLRSRPGARRRWLLRCGVGAFILLLLTGVSAPHDGGSGQALTPTAGSNTTARAVTNVAATASSANTNTVNAAAPPQGRAGTSASGAANELSNAATAEGGSGVNGGTGASAEVSAATSAASAAAGSTSAEKPGQLIAVTVVKDVDGDTIDVRMPDGTVEPVRMLLIDTPETVDPEKPVEPFGPQASAFCKSKLPVGKHVYLEEGIDKWDKYHRLLAYVWITPSDMYNEDVVRAGLARVAYVYPPNTKYLDQLEADQAYAKARHLGIWSIPGYVTDEGYNLAAVGKSGGSSTSTGTKASTGSTSGSALTVVRSQLKVHPGAEASVTIRTQPHATGTIEVVYKSGPSHAKGLEAKTADAGGYITWQWTVGSSTTKGTWPVHISAAGKNITLYLTVY